jgi:tetratricopeptide (TPR) repeat protein
VRRLAAGLLVAFALAGCGDADLWARWQAERALFGARREAARVEALGPGAGARERAAADARLVAIGRAFPASRWGASPGVRGVARDVARAAAGAALERGRLAESAGDAAAALARWREALAGWGTLPGAALEARLGIVRALTQLGRFDEALTERVAVASLDPGADPDRQGPSADVLAAPLAVARELREEGRPGDATALLTGAERRFAVALSRSRGADAVAIARALAGLRVERGDPGGALEALRTTLVDPRPWEVPPRVLALATCALEAGENDSAITYARWAAATSNTRAVAGGALVVAARAWEAKGRADSALATYDALFDRWNDPGSIAPEAHFRRATLLENLGQWERARSEFGALAAAAPSHPLAFQATLDVVRHHVKEGQYEMARIEGGNATARLDHLLATNRDPAVQRQARGVRAELLLMLGFSARAESCLVDLWRRFPEDSSTESAALRGASLAEHRPGGRPQAAALYDELAHHAASASVRRAAAERLARLGTPAAGPPAKEDRP